MCLLKQSSGFRQIIVVLSRHWLCSVFRFGVEVGFEANCYRQDLSGHPTLVKRAERGHLTHPLMIQW